MDSKKSGVTYPDKDDTQEFRIAKNEYVAAWDGLQRIFIEPSLYLLLLLTLVMLSFTVAFTLNGIPLDWLGIIGGKLETDGLLLLVPIIWVYVNVRYYLKIRKYQNNVDNLIQTEKNLNKHTGYEILSLGGVINKFGSTYKILLLLTDIFAGVMAVYCAIRAVIWLLIPHTVELMIVYIVFWSIFLLIFAFIGDIFDVIRKLAFKIAKHLPGLRQLISLIEEFIQYSDLDDYEEKIEGLSDRPIYLTHQNMLRHFKKLEGDLSDSPQDRVFEILSLAYLNTHETWYHLYRTFGGYFVSMMGVFTFITIFMGTNYSLLLLMPFIIFIMVLILNFNLGLRNVLDGYTYSLAIRLNNICGINLLQMEIRDYRTEMFDRKHEKFKPPITILNQKVSYSGYLIILFFVIFCMVIGFADALVNLPTFGYLVLGMLVVATPLYIKWLIKWTNNLMEYREEIAKERIHLPRELFGRHTDRIDHAYLGSHSYFRVQALAIIARTLFVLLLLALFLIIGYLNIEGIITNTVNIQLLNVFYVSMGFFFVLFYYYLIQIRGRETKGVGRRIEEYLGDTGIFAEEKEKTNYIASKPRKALISYLIPIILTLAGQVIVFLFRPWYLSVAWAAVIIALIAFSAMRLIGIRRALRREDIEEWFSLEPIVPLPEPDQG